MAGKKKQQPEPVADPAADMHHAMLELEVDVLIAMEMLPAWFVRRMMCDVWHFGLLVVGGQVINIQHIDGVRKAQDGSIWLDVELEEDKAVFPAKGHIGAPTSRLRASINAAHVIMAFETADT